MIRVRVRVRVRVSVRVKVRVRVRGVFFPHTHACKAVFQACVLVRVASGLVKSERVVKRVAPIPHATEHKLELGLGLGLGSLTQ